MLRKMLIVTVVILALLGLLVGGVIGYGLYTVDKVHDIALPDITRDTSPEALVRGRAIFLGICGECHLGGDGRFTGKHLGMYPEWMGNINSANITSHPEGGVGSWTDAELARVIKTGIGRDGKMRLMASFERMGDDDVAAVIGYLRSDAKEVEAVADTQPPAQIGIGGAVIVALMSDSPEMIEGIPVPEHAVTLEYGRYMANDVYMCVGCHTAGFSMREKVKGQPGMYAGNADMPLMDAEGGTYFMPNITFSETGIGDYSLQDFIKAVRHGIAKGGYVLRPEMPLFRFSDDVELEAIYNYIKTVPPDDRPDEEGTAVRPRDTGSSDPAELFTQLGCANCHGEGRPYRQRLKQAIGKDAAEVARWIRHAPDLKPGTPMPTYADLIDEQRASLLAEWVLKEAASL